MKEVHGISDALRVAMVSKDVQNVLVEDGGGIVYLALTTSSYPAGLTPDQAVFIAQQLVASAERVRAATPVSDTGGAP